MRSTVAVESHRKMEDFLTGPPPAYVVVPHEHLNDRKFSETWQPSERPLKDSKSCGIEDPPPYTKEAFPLESLNTGSFQFVYPLLTRPWGRFFSLCFKFQWSISAENFGHNLTYYQLNYGWMALFFVFVALVVVNSYDFNMRLLWTCVIVVLVYALNVIGFVPRLLGRKLTLSEQFTALAMFALPFYGLLPEAFPLIFFIVAFTCFVIAHACFTPAFNKANMGVYEIQHL